MHLNFDPKEVELSLQREWLYPIGHAEPSVLIRVYSDGVHAICTLKHLDDKFRDFGPEFEEILNDVGKRIFATNPSDNKVLATLQPMWIELPRDTSEQSHILRRKYGQGDPFTYRRPSPTVDEVLSSSHSGLIRTTDQFIARNHFLSRFPDDDAPEAGAHRAADDSSPSGSPEGASTEDIDLAKESLSGAVPQESQNDEDTSRDRKRMHHKPQPFEQEDSLTRIEDDVEFDESMDEEEEEWELRAALSMQERARQAHRRGMSF